MREDHTRTRARWPPPRPETHRSCDWPHGDITNEPGKCWLVYFIGWSSAVRSGKSNSTTSGDFAMKFLSLAVLVVIGIAPAAAADLPRSSPEAQGVSSAAVLAFIKAADQQIDSLHSFMFVRHGHVITEGWWAPYSAATPHSLYSLSKSFTSTAVGIAAAEGKLSVDDPVLKFFPKDAPDQLSANLNAMRLADLLRMSTGQQTEPPRRNTEPWAKTFLAHAVPFKPGTHFLYNTSATYMLSGAVQQATGQTVLDYLTPRLFEPLGIAKPTWEASPQGI